jgi:hypothetical protein
MTRVVSTTSRESAISHTPWVGHPEGVAETHDDEALKVLGEMAATA